MFLFDAFLRKYNLDDPALRALALIVRGADTDARQLTPESPGLYALDSSRSRTTTARMIAGSNPTHRVGARARTP